MRQGLYQPRGERQPVRRRIEAHRDRFRAGPASKLSVLTSRKRASSLWSFQNLIQVFERMRKNTNGSHLIISHQERILNIADEIVVIADGKIVNHGSRDEVMPQILGTASAVDACSKFYGQD